MQVPAWGALLLTYTAGLTLSIALAGVLVSEMAAWVIQAEQSRPEFAALRGVGVWSRAGLRWYLRPRRELFRLIMFPFVGPMIFFPLRLLQESEFTVILAAVATTALAEIGILCAVTIVSRADTDRRLFDRNVSRI